MSTSLQPPPMPFTDEEGYYVRDPQAVVNRADDQFIALANHLLALTQGIDSLAITLPPDQQGSAAQLKGALTAVQGDSTFLLALIRELAGYSAQLMTQRQSARDAYNRGWEERYQDILSQLHPVDQRMLRWIVEHVAADAHDELPF